MKRLFLYCILVLLLLFPSYLSLSTGKSEGKLGNTPGNILNGGTATENEDFYFWATLGEDEIYKSTKGSSKVQKIFDGKFGAAEINVSDGYVYFTDGTPGYLQKMTTNGKKRKFLTFNRVENVIVSGERIYYKTFKLKNDTEKVYSCDLEGRNPILLAKNVSQFCVDGETIYYTRRDDKNALWAMDISGKNKRKLNSEYTINPNFDDKYIYYTVAESFNVFRMEKENFQSECINNESCSNINISGDWIYYSRNRYIGPLCRMSKDGKIKEVLLDASVAEVNVVDKFVFYRRLDKDSNRYRLDLKTRENTKI